MTQIERECFDCDKTIKTEINQTVVDSQLRWYESYRCPFCNGMAEIDDIGFPPDYIRRIIIAEEELFSLSLTNFDADKIKAMKIIRQAFGLSLSEVFARFKSPASISTGTKSEMKWVQVILLDSSIDSVISKVV